MKTKYSKLTCGLSAVAMALALGACDDYLDITPPSEVSPEAYFSTADQLAAYTINLYTGSGVDGSRGSNAFPHHGLGGSSYVTFFDGDQGTDNENGTDNRFYDGNSYYTVGNDGGAWSFTTINNINYFIREVMPKYEA